jgi:predicted nucleic-acid-binding Zn-ribbon protein
MAKFFDAVRRGFKAMADANGPGRFAVEGKAVTCPHCGHDTFAEGSILLNTVGMTFFGLDWANRTASTLMCAQCGRIEWFGQKPERV